MNRQTDRQRNQGEVDGGRSQGVEVADDIRGTTDGNRADVRGSHSKDGEPMERSNTTDTEDLVRGGRGSTCLSEASDCMTCSFISLSGVTGEDKGL